MDTGGMTATVAETAAFYEHIRSGDGAFKFLCNGEWRVSTSGAVCENVNPSKANAPCFQFQACTPAEVDEAYATAKVAHKTWARTPLHKRAHILHKAAELMRRHQGPMADAMVLEIAKAAGPQLP
jgi:glyceraldehyde-3-phosphate dehydrogenase (NADP+)